jgi:hypothetical protein
METGRKAADVSVELINATLVATDLDLISPYWLMFIALVATLGGLAKVAG